MTDFKDVLETTVRLSDSPEITRALTRIPVDPGAANDLLARIEERLPVGVVEVADANGKIVGERSIGGGGSDVDLLDDQAPPIRQALDYERRITVVRGNQALLLRAVSPVIDPATDRLLGAIVVTEPLDSRFALRLKTRLGTDVAIFQDRDSVGSSFEASDSRRGRDFPTPRDPSRSILDGVDNVFEVAAFGRFFSVGHVPLLDDKSRRIGMLAAAIDEKSVLESRNNAWKSLLLGGSVAVAFAVWLGMLLSRRLTGPLGKLHGGALAVARGDYSPDFASTEGDEIAELTSAFGTMTAAVRRHEEEQAAHLRDLEAQKHEIESLNVELQRQVAERSRELREALARLHKGRTEGIEVGKIIEGRYRVLRRIGAGGMGAVYEVERISDGKHYALKTLSKIGTAESLARFAQEAEVTARLGHPNVIAMVDVGIDQDGIMFLVMELATGAPLEAQRSRFGDVPWSLFILKQLVAGLTAVHGKGIVHRDLKPANVLLAGPKLLVKIVDFGLGALGSEGLLHELAETAAAPVDLTQTGVLMGTPMYMAPELIHGVKDAPPSADVFSLGVMAFEMFTGQRPFPTPPILDSLHGRSLVPAPQLAIHCASLKPIIAAAFDRCLSFDPKQRPSAAELHQLLAGEVIEEPAPWIGSSKTMTLKD